MVIYQQKKMKKINQKINQIQQKNIKNPYNLRDKVIKLYNDYAKIMSTAAIKQNREQDLKN